MKVPVKTWRGEEGRGREAGREDSGMRKADQVKPEEAVGSLFHLLHAA